MILILTKKYCRRFETLITLIHKNEVKSITKNAKQKCVVAPVNSENITYIFPKV